ncbi:MAG: DUF2240 family protein, partial [Candidatus Hodarchaeales archaeon]
MTTIEELIQKISQHTRLSKEEITDLINKKKEELEFLINDIAAAHIIAKDHNVPIGKSANEKSPKLTIKRLKQMEPGLSGIKLRGVILRVNNPIEFKREGGKGLLVPILLHDGTESIRTVFWGNMAKLLADKKFTRGTIVELKQAYTKAGRTGNIELHMGDRGLMKEITDPEPDKYPDPDAELIKLDIIDEEIFEVDIKVTVMRLGRLVTFNRADGTEGKVANLIVKGEQVTRRMVFWDDQAENAFNFSRGDELLIQGANIKLDREGVPEIQTTRATYVTKIGHTALPPLEEKTEEIEERKPSELKNINEISSEDEYVSIQVNKGPISDIREFTRKDGSIGRVQRTLLFDESGIVTVVFWNETINDLEIAPGKSLKIENLRVNLSKFQTIELHTNNNTIITNLDGSQINDEPPIQEIGSLNPEKGVACIEGVFQNITDIREFSRSDGSSGRVASLTVEDNSDSTRVVGWNENVDKFEIIDSEMTKYVKILYGGIRKNQDGFVEIHLNNQSEVIGSEEIPSNLRNIQKREQVSSSYTAIEYIKTNLAELASDADDEAIEVVGKIIRLFQQTPYYWACPECNKRVDQSEDNEKIWLCREHDEIKPILRFRLSGLLDDSSGTIKVTFFGRSGEILTGFKKEDIEGMINKDKSDDEIFEVLQEEAEGKTVRILG